jgi:CheY-like chemotaxis protein
MTSRRARCRPILVVDDDKDIREILVESLQDRGFAVASARDGAEALAYLRA